MMKRPPLKWSIYLLTFSDDTGYVGASRNLKNRLSAHRNKWHLPFTHKVLEETTRETWRMAEKKWFDHYKSQGVMLRNKDECRHATLGKSDEVQELKRAPSINVKKRVKLNGKWRFLPVTPLRGAGQRGAVMIEGKLVQMPGIYYIEWRENGKRIQRPTGPGWLGTVAELEGKQREFHLTYIVNSRVPEIVLELKELCESGILTEEMINTLFSALEEAEQHLYTGSEAGVAQW
jgi:hypothetical protein